MRGALPGSILILIATILLALVTASVPVIKSIAFLTAKIGGSGDEAGATIKLGALGYCIGSTCKGPTIGYSFDPTQLLGVAQSVEGISIDSSKYSTAVIKGLTYTLVLHPIALACCVLTLLTGLLANCGDMSLKCLNSVFSSLASAVTLIAVACDFALFIIAEKRINNVSGASASLGNALWLTLIAWICIFLSSFFFCCGSSGRGSGGGKKNRNRGRDEYDDDAWKGGQSTNNYADQMRMDALDAENRRKNQKSLPQFATYETEHTESVPLKQDYEGQMAAGPGGYANVGNGGVGGAGHGYGNEYGYADGGYAGYTPGSEHAPYGGYAAGPPGANPMESYIPGVGPGAQRAVPSATSYHDGPQYRDGSQYHDTTQYQDGQAIGYAHQDQPSTYPGYHDDESMHSYGAHAQAPSWASHMRQTQEADDGYGMHSVPPVPAIPSHLQQQEGHSLDYSGASFGGGAQSSTSPSPYDAVQQATAAGQRSRALPNAPNAASPHADDGFGLAVLQAGQAAAAVNNSSSSRYTESSQPTSPTSMRSPPLRPLPSAPAGANNNEQHDASEPPDYESDHHAAAYNQYTRSAHEKR